MAILYFYIIITYYQQTILKYDQYNTRQKKKCFHKEQMIQ